MVFSFLLRVLFFQSSLQNHLAAMSSSAGLLCSIINFSPIFQFFLWVILIYFLTEHYLFPLLLKYIIFRLRAGLSPLRYTFVLLLSFSCLLFFIFFILLLCWWRSCLNGSISFTFRLFSFVLPHVANSCYTYTSYLLCFFFLTKTKVQLPEEMPLLLGMFAARSQVKYSME